MLPWLLWPLLLRRLQLRLLLRLVRPLRLRLLRLVRPLLVRLLRLVRPLRLRLNPVRIVLVLFQGRVARINSRTDIYFG